MSLKQCAIRKNSSNVHAQRSSIVTTDTFKIVWLRCFQSPTESSELDYNDARLYPHDRATASVTAGMDSKVISWDLWLDPDCGKMVPKKVHCENPYIAEEGRLVHKMLSQRLL